MRSQEGRMTPARSVGLVAAGLVAGGILAATIGANAAGSGSAAGPSSGTTTSTYAAGVPGYARSGPPGGFGAGHGRSDEKVVTGSNATALTDKAKAKVPGATVLRVETDAGDGVYEVHMQKTDGSLVTVKFDKNLNVTAVEAGMGKGDPMPSGGTAPSGSGSA
jgi:hypothetical protein